MTQTFKLILDKLVCGIAPAPAEGQPQLGSG
jgi:hypothetical protein